MKRMLMLVGVMVASVCLAEQMPSGMPTYDAPPPVDGQHEYPILDGPLVPGDANPPAASLITQWTGNPENMSPQECDRFIDNYFQATKQNPDAIGVASPLVKTLLHCLRQKIEEE